MVLGLEGPQLYTDNWLKYWGGGEEGEGVGVPKRLKGEEAYCTPVSDWTLKDRGERVGQTEEAIEVSIMFERSTEGSLGDGRSSACYEHGQLKKKKIYIYILKRLKVSPTFSSTSDQGS